MHGYRIPFTRRSNVLETYIFSYKNYITSVSGFFFIKCIMDTEYLLRDYEQCMVDRSITFHLFNKVPFLSYSVQFLDLMCQPSLLQLCVMKAFLDEVTSFRLADIFVMDVEPFRRIISQNNSPVNVIHSFFLSRINPFPYINALWCLCSKRMLKTLWQTEMSNLSFGRNVFKL